MKERDRRLLEDWDRGQDEHAVKECLTEWLQSFAACEVYWEDEKKHRKDESICDGVFEWKDTDSNESPDMVVEDRFGQVFVVEVKDAISSQGLAKMPRQTNRYWLQYCNGKGEYICRTQDKEWSVEVDAFLMATQFSLRGKLRDEYEQIENQAEKRDSPKAPSKNGHAPKYEFPVTKVMIRDLWSWAKYDAGLSFPLAEVASDGLDRVAGIGAILSDRLDGDGEGVVGSLGVPKLFFFTPERHSHNWYEPRF